MRRITFVSALPAYKNKLAGLKIESEKSENIFVSLFTLELAFAKQFLVGLFAEIREKKQVRSILLSSTRHINHSSWNSVLIAKYAVTG